MTAHRVRDESLWLCSCQGWNRPQVISCVDAHLVYSLRPPTHPHYLACKDRCTSTPSTWKAQIPRDFGSQDAPSNPNPTVTKTEAEDPSLNPSWDRKAPSPSSRQRDDVGVGSWSANRTFSVREDRLKQTFPTGNSANAAPEMLPICILWNNLHAEFQNTRVPCILEVRPLSG